MTIDNEEEHVSLFARVGDLVGSSGGGSGGSGGAPDGYFNVALDGPYTLGTIGTLTLYARGDSPSETSGDNTITVTGDAWKSPSGGTDSNRLTEPVSDTVVATVIDVDIDTDSDNSGFVDETPQEDAVEDDPPGGSGGESVPGNVLHWNHDDDDNNGVEDRLQGPGPLGFDDNDLELALLKVDDVAASAWVAGAAAGYQGLLEGVTLQISHSANLALWRTQDKEALELTYEFTAQGAPSNVPDEIYVEGLELGAGTVTWELILPTAAGAAVTSDTVKFTVVDVNLTIWDGVTPREVGEAEEESRGAFTVANRNDTDGDGVVDMSDTNGVVAGPYGRDEVDLMQLRVYCAGLAAGSVTLYVDPASDVRLWKEKTKITPIPITPCEGYLDGTVTFPVSGQLDETIYVELIGVSVGLRDYTIRLRYHEAGIEDTVKATAVWSQATAIAHDNATYADLVAQPEWADIDVTDPPKTSAQAIGTGLCPIPARLGTEEWVGNGIWFRFTVMPPGIQSVPNVKFDAARRTEDNVWALDASWEIAGPTVISRFPDDNEWPNDDNHEYDESDGPNLNRHMFSIDAPGVLPAVPPGIAYRVTYLNAEEYLRVAFDGTDPAGNAVVGSRASPKVEWKLFHTLQDDGTGQWERTTGDATEVAGENEVSLGRIEDLGDPSQPPPRP